MIHAINKVAAFFMFFWLVYETQSTICEVKLISDTPTTKNYSTGIIIPMLRILAGAVISIGSVNKSNLGKIYRGNPNYRRRVYGFHHPRGIFKKYINRPTWFAVRP